MFFINNYNITKDDNAMNEIYLKLPEMIKTHYIYYISTISGYLIKVGVGSMASALHDPVLSEMGEYECKIVFVDSCDTFSGALNKAANICYQSNRSDLLDQLPKKETNQGKRVYCVNTGETFSSISECAQKHSLSYPQLHKHLNGDKGYKTVKGKYYVKID